MTQRSVQSYDPLAYYVNTVGELDPHAVNAHKTKDAAKKNQLLAQGDKCQYDVYICVDYNWHGFVLVVPSANPEFVEFDNMIVDDPYKIPGQVLCWKYELRFEEVQLRMYKISQKFNTFEDIEKYTKVLYYIGRYNEVPIKGLQFAALSAAPHRYEVILHDCVNFAREYCISLLSYCSNGLDIEDTVHSNIKKATASGFTVEKLSRQSKLSGWVGNFSLGGPDVTSYLGERHQLVVLCLKLLFFLVYPIVAAFVVIHFLG